MCDDTNPAGDNLTRKLESIVAKDIMTKDVITTTEDAHLADLAATMVDSRVSGLPVVNGEGKLTGVVTATDLFIIMDMIKTGDVIEDGEMAVKNPTVKFAMSTEISKIEKNTTLKDIIALMKYKNKHTLPVFEKDKIVGVIGRRDVFKAFYAIVKELY